MKVNIKILFYSLLSLIIIHSSLPSLTSCYLFSLLSLSLSLDGLWVWLWTPKWVDWFVGWSCSRVDLFMGRFGCGSEWFVGRFVCGSNWFNGEWFMGQFGWFCHWFVWFLLSCAVFVVVAERWKWKVGGGCGFFSFFSAAVICGYG